MIWTVTMRWLMLKLGLMSHVDGAVGIPGRNKRWSAEPPMKPEELPEMRLGHWKT